MADFVRTWKRPPGPVRVRDDAGVVAARRQQEGYIRVGQQVDLEDRAPRRHVIALRADGEDRRADVADGDGPAVDLEAALGKIVVEEELLAGNPRACGTACGWRRRSRP